MKNIYLERKKGKERKPAVENSVFNSELWKSLWKKVEKEREKQMDYFSFEWRCPYYKWNDKLGVRCEGGRMKLPTDEASREYIRQYCDDLNGWRRCTVARAITRFYEAKFEDEEG